MFREIKISTIPGLFPLVALLGSLLAGAAVIAVAAMNESAIMILLGVVWCIATTLSFHGLFIVNPNQAQALQFFGRYVGSVRESGFHFSNPFYSRRPVSLRVRNFESNHLKVNDHDGNPIEIAAIVVWRVVDTAEALFEVEDYMQYVRVQTEAALRNLATLHPYDAHEDNQLSLRGATAEIAGHLRDEIQQRLSKAGVEVIEARISHLAYAPEIAAAMLRRQQASAIIAARQKIVEGAVTMVQMAIDHLTANNIVTLNNENKAALVNNLMVVLCSDHNAQPMVNAGAPSAAATTSSPPQAP